MKTFFCKSTELKYNQSDVIINNGMINGVNHALPWGMNWTYIYFKDLFKIQEKTKLLLVAFNDQTDKIRRKDFNREIIAKILLKNGFSNMLRAPATFFAKVGYCKFVISPEGFRVDCHRHYETWLSGGIPIIEENEEIRVKYKGLPILWTKDYSEITVDYLNQKWEEFKDKEFDYSCLFLSYYDVQTQAKIKTTGNHCIEEHGENKYYFGWNEVIKYFCLHPYKDYDYVTYVDKYKVKAVVKDFIHVADTYNYWNKNFSIQDIDSTLKYPYIIKGTHGCGWNYIIRSDKDLIKYEISIKELLTIQYRIKYEKQYAQVEPGIITEEYLGDNLKDYKFYMVNGKLVFIQFDIDRKGDHRQNYYDENWQLLPFTRARQNDSTIYPPPKNFEKMKDIVYRLTERVGNPPFVRVDIYNIDGKLYFGEFTFTPAEGTNALQPVEYQLKYGYAGTDWMTY